MGSTEFLLALVLIALAPTLAWGQGAGPGTGIQGTAHDFSNKSVTGGNGGQFTTGECTFCHTPHRALSTLLLWNRPLSTATYSWDAPTTTAGTKFPTFKGDAYKGPTAKCLSCHDGSVAIGDVAWSDEGKPAAPLDTTRHTWPSPFNIGATGGIVGNMTGNHPVAMPYPFNNAKNTYNGVTTGDAAILTEWQATPLPNIRIFNDDGSGASPPGPSRPRPESSARPATTPTTSSPWTICSFAGQLEGVTRITSA